MTLDIKDPERSLEWPRRDEGTGGTLEPPLGPLLFKLINGPLLLIDLIPEAGQLPVMGLTVILHLQLQGLLQRTQAYAQSQPLQLTVSTILALPNTPSPQHPGSPSLPLRPVCPVPCLLGPLHAQFLSEREEDSFIMAELQATGDGCLGTFRVGTVQCDLSGMEDNRGSMVRAQQATCKARLHVK